MAGPQAAVRRAFQSLGVPTYRRFFVGQLVSLVGSWAQTVGISWLVLKRTGSPLAVGTVTVLQFLPVAAFTLFGGVLAGRVPKRRVLFAVQSLALVQALVLGVLVALHVVELWHVYALAAVAGTLMAIEVPTRQAFVVELVGRELLPNAVALHAGVFNAARVLGPGLGGLAIAWLGTEATFFVNAASFVPVIVVYATLRDDELQPVLRARSADSVMTQVAQGLVFSLRDPTIRQVVVLIAFFGTFGFNFNVFIPLVAEFVLRVGPERFGLLSSCLGIGSVVAALLQAFVARASVHRLLVASTAFVVFLGAIPVTRSYGVTAALLFGVGLGAVTLTINANTLVQLSCPDELRARVMSVYFFVLSGSAPVGGWFTGYVAEHAGVPRAVLVDAGLAGVGIVLAVLSGTARRPQPPQPLQAQTPP